MAHIRILPEILSNKIAAGEVVERPASVVKELLENALDAGSTRITIEIENGGRRLVRVADNGTGMSRDNALLSIERYATSKIFDDADLFAIRTLGFRGEALPSIAAVSRFTLVTRDPKADAGTEILIAGGRLTRVSEIGAPPGTMISVKNLFFNTPARRKFLKTIPTEMSHVADIVDSMALGRPDVHFRLLHNNKRVKDWIIAAKPIDRVVDVLGNKLKNDLYPVETSHPTVSVSGWIADPRHVRSTSRGIFIFVNGRRVKDRVILHALFESYRQRLVKGQFPIAVLFLKIPFDQVDVNVHPTKHEVRFFQQERVHEAVKTAAFRVLAGSDRPRWVPEPQRPVAFKKMRPPEIAEPLFNFRPTAPDIGRKPNIKPVRPEKEQPDTQVELWTTGKFSDLRVIGQFSGTYLVCEAGEELVLIDQHAAHERIVFEQLKKQAAAARKASQRLLVPETVEMGFREAQILDRLIPELSRLGLDIEPFGGNTFVIKAVPAVIANRQIAPLIVEIVEQTAAVGFGPDLMKTLEQCLIVMACHGTIRAHHPLSEIEIKTLLTQLDACENPSTAPTDAPPGSAGPSRSWKSFFTGLCEPKNTVVNKAQVGEETSLPCSCVGAHDSASRAGSHAGAWNQTKKKEPA